MGGLGCVHTESRFPEREDGSLFWQPQKSQPAGTQIRPSASHPLQVDKVDLQEHREAPRELSPPCCQAAAAAEALRPHGLCHDAWWTWCCCKSFIEKIASPEGLHQWADTQGRWWLLHACAHSQLVSGAKQLPAFLWLDSPLESDLPRGSRDNGTCEVAQMVALLSSRYLN